MNNNGKKVIDDAMDAFASAIGHMKDGVRNVVAGVGRDEPTVVNEKGGKQSRVLYRFDLLDPEAMFEMTKVLKEGAEKYGDDNWRNIPVRDHLNHLIIHAYAYLAGDESDEHLSHIMCRAMFAQAVDIDDKRRAKVDEWLFEDEDGPDNVSDHIYRTEDICVTCGKNYCVEGDQVCFNCQSEVSKRGA